MNKLGAVAIVVAVVIAANLFLLVAMPVIADMVSTANTTITASSNWADYPGTQGFLVSTPWILYFVPNVIGMVAVVLILRRP